MQLILLGFLGAVVASPTYYDNSQRGDMNGVGKIEDIAVIVDPQPLINEKTVGVVVSAFGREGQGKGMAENVFEKLVKLFTLGQSGNSGQGMVKLGRFLDKALESSIPEDKSDVKPVEGASSTTQSRRKREIADSERTPKAASPVRYDNSQRGNSNGVGKVEDIAIIVDPKSILTAENLAYIGLKRSPNSEVAGQGKTLAEETAFEKFVRLYKHGEAGKSEERLTKLGKFLDTALDTATEEEKEPEVDGSTVAKGVLKRLGRMLDVTRSMIREGRRFYDDNINPNEIPRVVRTQHFSRGPQPFIQHGSNFQEVNLVHNQVVDEDELDENENVENEEEEEEEDDNDEDPYEPSDVNKSTEESLSVIGGNPEGCGPDGHRNSEGICIYGQ